MIESKKDTKRTRWRWIKGKKTQNETRWKWTGSETEKKSKTGKEQKLNELSNLWEHMDLKSSLNSCK